MQHWFEVNNTDELITPALLFYPDRIEKNIDRMIRITGSPDRIRAHVKTYKCPEIVSMQMNKGITKFKCATLAEALMVAATGAKDILIAFPLTGPAQKRFIHLTGEFPHITFSTLIDHPDHLKAWNAQQKPVNLFVDLDAGMHRTGISMAKAADLFHQIKKSNHHFMGWHIYDGHIHHSSPHERTKAVDEAYQSLPLLIEKTASDQYEIICGSSITFPIHARHQERQLSPGTTLLWDQGYSSKYPDLKFDIAATTMTRIISKPNEGLLCLDLGYKAIASEMTEPPVYFPQIPDAIITTHSEEHLVIKTDDAIQWKIGDIVYGVPWHICPTVALYEQAAIVRDRLVHDFWNITARKRLLRL